MSAIADGLAVTLDPNVRVEPPARLPVEHLSLSSLRQFQMCPQKWRRRYIEHQYEPPSGKMTLGGAAGAALHQHYGLVIESGAGLSTEDLLDEFSTEWEDRISRDEVDFEGDSAGAMKDSGAGALRIYHQRFAPEITPVSVEREFRLSWPGVQWVLTGFVDLEDAAGLVRDFKMSGKRLSQSLADADLQPTTYLAARRAEGNPAAGFAFDTMIRTQTPKADVVHTTRSEAQLDHLSERVFTLAREIAWRTETDTWSGAPPNTWFCGTCRYLDCPWRLG